MSHLRSVARRLGHELALHRALLRHPGTPRTARLLLASAIGYALLPFDIIPDFIPLVGHLDDLVIVPALVALAVSMIPSEVVAEARSETRDAPILAPRPRG